MHLRAFIVSVDLSFTYIPATRWKSTLIFFQTEFLPRGVIDTRDHGSRFRVLLMHFVAFISFRDSLRVSRRSTRDRPPKTPLVSSY